MQPAPTISLPALLQANTSVTGNSNAALGTNSLNKLTSGSYNTALGFSALQNNTTGFRSTATGYNALNKNTTGDTIPPSETEPCILTLPEVLIPHWEALLYTAIPPDWEMWR